VFRRSKAIRDSLTKTRRGFFGQITGLLAGGEITEETWEDLEALLVQADVGVNTTIALVDRLREQVAQGKARSAQDLQDLLKLELLALLGHPRPMTIDDLGTHRWRQWFGKDDEHRQTSQVLPGSWAQGRIGCGRHL
jgi:signal recognition particle GTPase